MTDFDPLDYPWPEPHEAAPDLSLVGRTLVLAVGSNAYPSVLRRKLAAVDPAVPTAACVVTGLAVGHSAHVSAGGYIPAAPYASPGSRTPMRAGWFTPAQLAALDGTEPNYQRVSLPVARFAIDLDVEAFDVYRSRWGVLAHLGVPLVFQGQRELRALLERVPRETVPDGLTR